MINPVIEPVSNKMEVDWEACLSVPGMMGQCLDIKISYTWSDLQGKKHGRSGRRIFC